jgi:hypothetical protein
LAVSQYQQAAQVREVLAGLTAQVLRPASSALTQIQCRNLPNAASCIRRFNACLAATFRPGFSFVPRALRVMFASFRSSNTITPWRSTRSLAV